MRRRKPLSPKQAFFSIQPTPVRSGTRSPLLTLPYSAIYIRRKKQRKISATLSVFKETMSFLRDWRNSRYPSRRRTILVEPQFFGNNIKLTITYGRSNVMYHTVNRNSWRFFAIRNNSSDREPVP
jgi:hypothetical protein